MKTDLIHIDIDSIAQEFGPKITSLCKRMVQNHEQAQDTAQNVWIEILKSLPSFKGTSSLSTWIYTITYRTINRFIKNETIYTSRNLSLFFKSKEKFGMSEMAEIPVEDQNAWIQMHCSDCITAMLHCLDNESRMIYLLRSLTPLKYSDISIIFDKTESAVRKNFSRSSRKIQRFLSGNCTLFNSEGDCSCKMKQPLEKKQNSEEFIKIRSISKSLFFIRTMDDITSSQKNWIQSKKI